MMTLIDGEQLESLSLKILSTSYIYIYIYIYKLFKYSSMPCMQPPLYNASQVDTYGNLCFDFLFHNTRESKGKGKSKKVSPAYTTPSLPLTG